MWNQKWDFGCIESRSDVLIVDGRKVSQTYETLERPPRMMAVQREAIPLFI
jgi:hypothetical protein